MENGLDELCASYEEFMESLIPLAAPGAVARPAYAARLHAAQSELTLTLDTLLLQLHHARDTMLANAAVQAQLKQERQRNGSSNQRPGHARAGALTADSAQWAAQASELRHALQARSSASTQLGAGADPITGRGANAHPTPPPFPLAGNGQAYNAPDAMLNSQVQPEYRSAGSSPPRQQAAQQQQPTAAVGCDGGGYGQVDSIVQGYAPDAQQPGQQQHQLQHLSQLSQQQVSQLQPGVGEQHMPWMAPPVVPGPSGTHAHGSGPHVQDANMHHSGQ